MKITKEMMETDELEVCRRLSELYWTRGLSIVDLGKLVGIPRSSMWEFLKKHHVPLRKPYGKIKYKGRVITIKQRRLNKLTLFGLLNDSEKENIKKVIQNGTGLQIREKDIIEENTESATTPNNIK